MNICIVSIWFKRGQSYCALQVKKAFNKAGHNTFIFARQGSIGSVKCTEKDNEFNVENLRLYSEYIIDEDYLTKYLLDNKINAVIFLEEQWQIGLGKVCQNLNIPSFNIIVWETFHNSLKWKAHYNSFTKLIFPINAGCKKALELGYMHAEWIHWGIDLNIWNKDKTLRTDEDLRFIHIAGWGGMYERKQTQLVINAFEAINIPNVKLMVYKQSLKYLDKNKVKLTRMNKNIWIYEGNVELDIIVNAYRHSDVAVICSKWEGLGYNLIEPQAIGLPIITVDAPPMNEWVIHNYNGRLCDVRNYEDNKGIAVKGAITTKEEIIKQVEFYSDRLDLLEMQSRNAKRYALEYLDWNVRGEGLVNLVEQEI